VHHLDAASTPFCCIRPQWDQPIERIRLVDGDTELLPGLELIETSGHVPGHQSVLVRLPKTGAVLLTIDAVPSARALFVTWRTMGAIRMPKRFAPAEQAA